MDSHSYQSIPLKKSISKDDSMLYYDTKDAEHLSPTSHLVYHQWKIDEGDELLIDAYFRTYYGDNPYILPNDIKNIIASYYQKSLKKKHINAKIERIANATYWNAKIANAKIRQRKKNCLNRLISCFLVIVSLSFLFGVDIAGFIINAQNDCNLALKPDPKIDFVTVSEFLFIGCLIGIIIIVIFGVFIGCISCLVCLSETDSMIDHVSRIIGCISCLVCSFLFSWAIIGFLFYSDMDKSTTSNKQCADVVLAWGILKVFEMFFIFFVLSIWTLLGFIEMYPG